MVATYIIVWSLFTITEGCAPPPSFGSFSPPSGSFSARQRAFGEQTEKANAISAVSIINAPIQDTSDLLCYDFDESCHWHNMGFGIDRLDWYQGAGALDTKRLQLSTGTSMPPDGTYAIVATDSVQSPTTEAVLVSDVIECQRGPAELRFMYWSSPEVRIIVCTKRTTKLYPDFDFCHSPVEIGDPGPAYLLINDINQQPFQIFIRASSFVFHAPNLEGGFAIIDNIEYYGDLCSNPFKFMAQKQNSIFSPSITVERVGVPDLPTLAPTLLGLHFDGDDEEELKPDLLARNGAGVPSTLTKADNSKAAEDYFDLEEFTSNPIPSLITTSTFALSQPVQASDVKTLKHTDTRLSKNEVINLCDVLYCNFSTAPCIRYVKGSEWKISYGPVGKSSKGIAGDASRLPYDKDSAFAYIKGPVDITRLIIPSFNATNKFYFVFWYYKSSKDIKLRVVTKRVNEIAENTIYMAPENQKNSRRWFREVRVMPAAPYDYVAFEARDLKKDDFIGIDELTILDGNKGFVCNN